MAINFPDTPNDGDSYTAGGRTWVYDSAVPAWQAQSVANHATTHAAGGTDEITPASLNLEIGVDVQAYDAQLASLAGLSYTGNTLKVVRVNVGETAFELAAPAGGGDLLAANNLSDLTNAATARTNLGLGSLATQSGTFSGTSSGTNTGDQTITLTGDVTGSGTSSFSATITNSAVTLAKMADVATASVFYRKTAGTGVPEVQTLATLKTDLGLTGTNSGDQDLSGLCVKSANLSDLTNAATARTNLGLVIGTDVQAYNASLAAIAAGTWTGATSITTLGTVATGTWQGSAITGAYLNLSSPPAIGGTTPAAIAGTTLSGTSTLTLGVASTTAGTVLLKNAGGTGTTTIANENSGNSSYTWTVPAATDTAVGKATTDTLTNKTISTGCVIPWEITIACSDETTAITQGNTKVTFRMPWAATLTAVRAGVTTAPTGSTILIDINENGVSVLSTKLMIDATEKTSTTAATPYVISDSTLADDAEITIDFDQVGSTIAGAGVKVTLIGTRTV